MDRMISLILPCRNQADHIGALLTRYLHTLEAFGQPFELVVVPNKCSDATLTIVEDLAERDGRLRCVPNPLGGWGRSVRVGLEAARGSILAYTNAARTEPESLPSFLKLFADNPGTLVKARREQRNAPLREIGSFLYNAEAKLLFRLDCDDVNGTPKIFGADFYRDSNLTADGDLLDLELMSRAKQRGLAIREIPVAGFKRHGGKSSTTFKSAWAMYMGAVRLRFQASGQKPVGRT
jgi:glycosyltransferase involved in cell wall biosynthesis